MALISTNPLSLTNYGEYLVLNSFFTTKYEKEKPRNIFAHLCDFSNLEATTKPYKLENDKYKDLKKLILEGLVTEPSQEAYEPYRLKLTEDDWTISLDGSDYKATTRNLIFISKEDAWDTVTHVVLTEGKNDIIAYAELTSPLTLAANTAYFLTCSVTYKDASGSSGLFSEGSRIILESFFHSLDRYEHIKTISSYKKKTFWVALFSNAPSQTDKLGDLTQEPDSVVDSPWYSRPELPLDSWEFIKETNYKIKEVISKPAIFENRGAVSAEDKGTTVRSVLLQAEAISWIAVSYAVLIFQDYSGILYPIDYTTLTGAPNTLDTGERIKIKYEFKQH